MRKKIAVGLSIASLAVASIAFAQVDEQGANTGSTAATGTGTQATAQTQGADWREKMLENQQQRQQIRDNNQAIRDNLQQQKQDLVNQKCQMIQQRIQERVSNFNSNNGTRAAVYTNMVNRIQKFIATLSGDGYDTSKVQSDLTTLNQKIQQFQTDKQAQMAQLSSLQGLACGHSNGEFMTGLTQDRTLLATVHKDALDIRQFMLTTVRPDILALRQKKAAANATKTETENPAGSTSSTTTTTAAPQSEQ